MELKSKKIYINERLRKLMKRMIRGNCDIEPKERLERRCGDSGSWRELGSRGRRNRERAGQCLDERVQAEWWKNTR
jgi:hypothetical protein